GFGMDILYHNRTRHESLEKKLDATYVPFQTLLTEADFVVSLVPLTEETEELFNEAAFRKMKSSAIFINASRGGVVDEQALSGALRNGYIHAAGLDVFKEEPINSSHPLNQLSNVTLLPHIGSASVQTREKMIQLCLDNVSRVCHEQKAVTPVE